MVMPGSDPASRISWIFFAPFGGKGVQKSFTILDAAPRADRMFKSRSKPQLHSSHAIYHGNAHY
jgi:hypothetical protein